MAVKVNKKASTDDFLKLSLAKQVDDSGIAAQIVTYYTPQSVVAEQYRIICTHIQQIITNTPLKTLLISSAAHKEGKSSTSVNLAIIMARKDESKNVLLLDCDLRKGTLHKIMGIKQTPGLSGILSGKDSPVNTTVQRNRIPNLDIISCGENPPNPSDLLSSDKMKELLAVLKSKYDQIIIDSPPILPVTDTHILSSQADGVIMVVQAGHTQREQVLHAQLLLKQVQANIIGFILTQVEYFIPQYFYNYLKYSGD